MVELEVPRIVYSWLCYASVLLDDTHKSRDTKDTNRLTKTTPKKPDMSESKPLRLGQIVRLKREALTDYKACHDAVWPAVLKQIQDCNIVDYSIFLDEGSMTLFATMKYTGSDFDGDMEKMRANVEVQKWWKMTDGMQETLVEGSTGSTDPIGWWKPLDEVFRVE
jgi:L-rhamnose mutarotase